MGAQGQDKEAEQKALALFDLATDEYFDQAPTELRDLERIHRWAHKALELFPHLSEEQTTANFMGNLCAVLGWTSEEEEQEEKATEYYGEAVRWLGELHDLCWHEQWLLGMALAAVGQLDKALRTLELAVDVAVPGNSRGHDPEDWDLAAIWVDIAHLHKLMEDPQESIEAMQWALSYAPQDEEIRGSLILECLFLDQFGVALDTAREGLEAGCENRGLFLEYMATASTLSGDLKLAIQTYSELKEMATDLEAREWYTRMLGYVEGLHDGQASSRAWDREGWEWELHGGGIGETQGLSLDQMEASLREEIRDTFGRLSLQLLQTTEASRSAGLAQERDKIYRQLRDEAFGQPLWESLQRETQAALIEAELSVGQRHGDRKADYSAPVTQYQKALEIEIGQRLLSPFSPFVRSEGYQEWRIGQDKYKTRRLERLDLPKVHQLIRSWTLSLDPPRTITQAELQLRPDPAESSVVADFFSTLDERARELTLGRLRSSVEWIPNLGMKAKHRSTVSEAETIRIRKELIGSHANPGLLIQFVQFLPTSA